MWARVIWLSDVGTGDLAVGCRHMGDLDVGTAELLNSAESEG